MAVFGQSRSKNVYSRPSKASPAGDPIPTLINDTYHLFHLAGFPGGIYYPKRVRCSWNHMRSKDLVEWIHDVDSVLSPGNDSLDDDADGAWTGSVLVDLNNKLHIFYTGYNLTRDRQVILHATCADKNEFKFFKPQSPIQVIGNIDAFETIDFRDPYVFYNLATGSYWMLIATRLSQGPHWTRGCVTLLTSADLETWHVEKEPLYAPNDIFCPECPELFSLPNGKWYLVYSRFSAPDAGTVYRVADSPHGPFRTPRDGSSGRFDGRRWYAAKSCYKAGDPSRRIFFGWVPDFHAQDQKWLWGGQFLAPREVSANADGTLSITPVADVVRAFEGGSLLQQAGPSTDQIITSIGKTTFEPLPLSPTDVGKSYSLKFMVPNQDAKTFGVVINGDDDMRGHRLLFEAVSPSRFSLTLLTDVAPLDDFWADLNGIYVPRPVDGAELVKHGSVSLEGGVQVFVNGDILEVFVGGRTITYRIPPRDSQEKWTEGVDHEHNGVGMPRHTSTVHPLGFFVEDGQIQLSRIQVNNTLFENL
ncbi:Glycosyl hydrolase family 32 domain-containing protein [Cladophialophora immunda]|nr:Glycosyl hydrolase family 32 domain-containing protein [Cladophialophora immunda]